MSDPYRDEFDGGRTPLRDEDFLPPPVPRLSPKIWRVSAILFALTCLSTLWAGMGVSGLPLSASWGDWLWAGFSYAGPLVLILGCHEMGHYLQTRRYGVLATPPFFIPMPLSPFGTMGAVILQGTEQPNRKALFDIAISGPLAGLVIALPVAWFGIEYSELRAKLQPHEGGWILGDPLVLQFMVWLKHGPLPAGVDVQLNPLLFAGWVGIFLTALNMLPVGQLDGGHVMYGLLGRRAGLVAMLTLGGLVLSMALSQSWDYLFIVLLLTLLGVAHPPTANDAEPLGLGRAVLGWLTLGFLFVGFTANPLTIKHPEAPPPVEQPALPPTNEPEIAV